jgi:beta-glucanase (GH16 family)
MSRPPPTSRRRTLHRLGGAAAGALLMPWAAARAGAPAPADPAPSGEATVTPAPIRGRGLRLVQDWDFARTVTDERRLREHFHTRYIYENGTLDTLNDEWQRYRDNANHVFRGDGTLALVARVAPGAAAEPGRIESGMLRSKWSGQYGYFEIRMQVPPGRGLWPAFWLNPQDGRWPPEIDVVEVVNNGRDTTRHSFHILHGGEPAGGEVESSRLDRHRRYAPGIDYADGFHRYAVDWTEDRVRHYVDDELVVDRRWRWRHRDGADGGPAHVLVNLAVGGKWPGAPGPGTLPAELRIAHIRVWQA